MIGQYFIDIFLNDVFLFGPKEYVTDQKEYWINLFNKYVAKNKPIPCNIMGFPFKIPVALKTSRLKPDLGDLLSLNLFFVLSKTIKKIYPPGLNITIVSEDSFFRFSGVTEKEAMEYQNFLRKISEMFGYDTEVHFKNLSEVISKFPDFEETYKKTYAKNTENYANNETALVDKINSILPSIFYIVDSRQYSEDDLYEVYLDSEAVSQNPNLQTIKDDLKKKSIETALKYISFLDTRDILKIFETEFPDSVRLSYAPKPGRIGVRPGGEKMILLPTHGVPVKFKNDDTFSIVYLHDILNDAKKYEASYFESDEEDKPFFYIEK